MPIARSVLERLLTNAQRNRDTAAGKVSGDDKSACPAWRNADARYRQLVRRLRAVSATEKRDQELASRTAGDEE